MSNNNFKIISLKNQLKRIQKKILEERCRLEIFFIEDARNNQKFCEYYHSLYKEADDIIGEIIDAQKTGDKTIDRKGIVSFAN